MDHIDRKIIDLLQNNARAPLKEIADHVFLSSPAVSARMARLESSGTITGYQAQVDAPKLGYMVKAFINLDMDPQRKPEFYPYIQSCPPCGGMQLRHRRLLHAHRSSLPLHHGTGPLHQRTPAVRPYQNTDRILHQRRTQRSAGGVTIHRHFFINRIPCTILYTHPHYQPSSVSHPRDHPRSDN